MLRSLGLLVSLAFLASVLLVAATKPLPAFIKATHKLTFQDGGVCSGTAVGPHAILTATHCEVSTGQSLLIGSTRVQIVGVMRDGSDHTLLLITGASLPHVVTGEERTLAVGESIRMVGNPGGVEQMFRRGYIMGGTTDSEGERLIVLDINGFPGDSGAGLIDAAGHVVGVISLIHTEWRDDPCSCMMKTMAAFPLAFSQQQIQKARVF